MTRETRIHEAAASWFLRLNGQGCSDADRDAFRAWRADPKNAAAYAAVEAAWVWSGSGANALEMRAHRQEARALPRRRPWPGMATAIVAAVILATAGILLWSPARHSGDTQLAATPPAETPAPNAGVYSTAIGERSTVTLDDGSVVFLNTNTRLRADYSADARKVVLLEGQALFEVAKHPERPFVVVAGDRRVTALGTAFDVRLDEDRFQVTLIEGRVRVEHRSDDAGARHSGRTELQAGQQLIDSALSGVEVRKAPVGRVTSWREGRLIFEDEPLAAAVSEMNRYSTTRILLDDPALERLRVSGVFRTGQPDVFVEALVAYFPIEVAPSSAKDEIVLTHR